MRLLCPILLAASLAPLSAVAQTPHADAPTLSVETRAQDLYVSGRDRFRAKDFPGALDDFRRSLDLVDSPNTRMYLGRALRRLRRLPEAFATFERAASDAERRAVTEPRYAATRESARAEADEIRGDIALLTVRLPHLPPGASIRVAGAEVPVTAIGYPLPFAPGEVIVEFDAPGYAPAREILILAPGGNEVVDLTPRADRSVPSVEAVAASSETARPAVLPQAPARRAEPSRPWSTTRVLGVTALSAGVATVVTGVVFGALAWSEYESLLPRPQQERDQSLVTQGEFHRDLANVLIASGSAIALGGLVLFWLSGRSASDAPRPPVQVDVGLNAGGATLRLGGTL
jgi:tetratricopeptide (TPR) repeat protein